MQVIAGVGTMITASEDGQFHAPTPGDFWQPLFGEGALAFTRPMAIWLIVALIVGGVLLWASSNASVVPTRKQHYVEQVYYFVRNTIGRDMIGSAEFRRFVPLLFTLFTFILLNNLMGVIPPFQNPPTGRISFPLALTIVVYLTYHFVGIRKFGVGGYLKNMVPPGLPVVMVPVIFLLEAATKFIIQPLTLTLRLFGIMFAGHMVLVLFILGGEFLLLQGDGVLMKAAGVAALGGGVLMTVFEILIQFLQAYVFTLLTASYIGSALAEEH